MGIGAEDAELALAARSGSQAAFGRLVDRHQQAVRAFLRRTCSRADEADDLAQETFLTAWSTLERYRPDASFRAWLYAIAYRKRLGFERGQARGARRDAQWLETRPTSDTASREDAVAVKKAMEGLSLEQRAAVALCLAGDFSHAEAAQALGSPVGTVKSHVARGRARLLQALGVEDDAS
jgi:RNA polymerase sigma-70 factor (ECF subfamily)